MIDCRIEIIKRDSGDGSFVRTNVSEARDVRALLQHDACLLDAQLSIVTIAALCSNTIIVESKEPESQANVPWKAKFPRGGDVCCIAVKLV